MLARKGLCLIQLKACEAGTATHMSNLSA